jgi:hypothetical protein
MPARRNVSTTVADSLEALAAGVRDGAFVATTFEIRHLDDGSHIAVLAFLEEDDDEGQESTAKHAKVVPIGSPPREDACVHCGSTRTKEAGRNSDGDEERICIACGKTWAPPRANGG